VRIGLLEVVKEVRRHRTGRCKLRCYAPAGARTRITGV
jgi:hypothetical protein